MDTPIIHVRENRSYWQTGRFRVLIAVTTWIVDLIIGVNIYIYIYISRWIYFNGLVRSMRGFSALVSIDVSTFRRR